MKQINSALIESEAIHTTRHKASRSEIDAAYFSAERSGVSEITKAPERQKVLEFILGNLSTDRPKFLTNPGLKWRFEHAVDDAFGHTKSFFVGVERSPSILESSRKYMPGVGLTSFDVTTRRGNFSGFTSARGIALDLHIEYYPSIVQQVHDREFIHSQWWPRHWSPHPFFSMDAAWVDIWSPVGHPVFAKMLRDLPKVLRQQCPLVFTFQYGRDAIKIESDNPLQTRSEMIKSELEYKKGGFQISNVWHYYGLNNCRMATVCGIYTK